MFEQPSYWTESRRRHSEGLSPKEEKGQEKKEWKEEVDLENM